MSQVTSLSAMLVDADTGEVLFSKNADWTIFPASTTKLMTAILVSGELQTGRYGHLYGAKPEDGCK